MARSEQKIAELKKVIDECYLGIKDMAEARNELSKNIHQATLNMVEAIRELEKEIIKPTF